ncbi:MAG: Mrp/NBP35 family ATP-binding protein [Candidatus Zixiibacteriota bacterium]
MLTNEQRKHLEAENKAILHNVQSIKHRIIVLSGKGGVGKTTVSVNLAYTLRARGCSTGLLDADVTGPNIPKMLGLAGELHSHEHRIIPLLSDNVKVVSIANILNPDQPVLWRGPMRSKLLHQFLGFVEWGDLDYLVADLPPGTGDEIITLIQKMKPDLAVVVTTPQEVSLIDSRRAINMAREMGLSNIGIIENMSGLKCPYCGGRIDLFGKDGGRKQAEDMHVTFLGSLPIDIQARITADKGKPVVLSQPDSEIAVAIEAITEKVVNIFGS